MSVGNRIAEFCDQKDMKLPHFAKKIGVGQSIVYKWNRGEANPNYSAIMSIKTFFPDLNMDWLLFGEGEMLNNSTNTDNSSLKNLSNVKEGVSFVANNKAKITPMTEEERATFLQMQETIKRLEQQNDKLMGMLETLIGNKEKQEQTTTTENVLQPNMQNLLNKDCLIFCN